ncbi:MAG: AraC family transcriptional regulator [Eubacteriales bacterium]
MENKLFYKKDGFKNEQYIIVPIASFKSYVKHPLVKRLYLTDVGYFPLAKNHYRERKEGIEEYILIYCTDGKGTIEVNDKKHELSENCAFCIPKNTKHRYYSSVDNPWSILWIHFKGDDTIHYPLNYCKVVQLKSIRASKRIIFLFDMVFNVLEKNYTLGNFIYLSEVLSLILSEVYYRSKSSDTETQNKHLTFAIRYMYKNLDKSLTLSILAKELELSKSYLNTLFTKHTKRSPIDFFISLKMDEACKLLKLTDLYIYEVGQKLGYDDPYYFSRIFKKFIGMSPRAYKKVNT